MGQRQRVQPQLSADFGGVIPLTWVNSDEYQPWRWTEVLDEPIAAKQMQDYLLDCLKTL